jgi:hypothetical protein
MKGASYLKPVLVLSTIVLLLSCSTSLTTSETKAPQKIENGMVPPEVVRSEEIHIEDGRKMLTVGNIQGHYLLACKASLDSCVTPVPGKDYLLFTKATQWRMPGAKDKINLAWIQDWTVSYPNQEENIALVPDGDSPGGLGMYWLRSWNSNK